MEEAKIEKLDRSKKSELLELFAQAFADHPLLSAIGQNLEKTRAVMKAVLNLFMRWEEPLLYGIRKDGRLACASLSVDAKGKPSVFTLVRFVLALARALGWRTAKEFVRVFREQPRYEERYLELAVLGTSPACQNQGLGRRMMNFLYEEAKSRGYSGVILVTDRNTPAFNLYLKEGFSVDKDLPFRETTLSCMRLSF